MRTTIISTPKNADQLIWLFEQLEHLVNECDLQDVDVIFGYRSLDMIAVGVSEY